MASKSISKAFAAARPQHHHNPAVFIRTCRAAPPSSHLPTSHPSTISSSPAISAQKRLFSCTRSPRATITKHNPRVDDDGNEMQIIISERAAKRLRKIVSTPPKRNSLSSAPETAPDAHLRVSVTSGGCHGFQYLMALEPADRVDPEEDTIFEFEDSGEGANVTMNAKAEVVMDLPSLELLKGSTVDFTTELIGSQFKIVGNPRATSSCGCGTSFDIDI